MRTVCDQNQVSIWGKAFVAGVVFIFAKVILLSIVQPFTASSMSGIAVAEEAATEQPKQKRKTKRTQALNNKVYEKLQAAQAATEEQNYAEARKIIQTLKTGKKKLNDFEQANVLTLEAFIAYSKEDYLGAITAYKKIISLPEAPEGMVIQTRYQLAQLYFVMDDYQAGVKALEEWFKVATNPRASAYMLMGQACYQLKRYRCAMDSVNTAITMYKDKGKVPKESWYSLQRFLYYEKNDYNKVVSILDEMLLHYPKKQYWLQLSAMHAELKHDKKQLAAMDVAYVQGMLEKESELVNMAYLYIGNDEPYKGAKVLDEGIKAKLIKPTAKNLELLGSAWHAAQEVKKAIPEMKRAAEESDKGQLWARLGNIYLDNDNYTEAIDAVQSGLKKGGVKRLGTAYLVLGMAHFNLKRYGSARKAFNEAKKDKRSEKYALQWLNFLDKEVVRIESLRAEL